MSKPSDALPPICREVRALIELQLEDAPLLPEETLRTDSHLMACGHCRLYQDEALKAISLVKSLALLPVPDDLADRVMLKLNTAQMPARRPAMKPYYLPVAAVALLLLVMVPLRSVIEPARQAGQTKVQVASEKPGSASTLSRRQESVALGTNATQSAPQALANAGSSQASKADQAGKATSSPTADTPGETLLAEMDRDMAEQRSQTVSAPAAELLAEAFPMEESDPFSVQDPVQALVGF